MKLIKNTSSTNVSSPNFPIQKTVIVIALFAISLVLEAQVQPERFSDLHFAYGAAIGRTVLFPLAVLALSQVPKRYRNSNSRVNVLLGVYILVFTLSFSDYRGI